MKYICWLLLLFVFPPSVFAQNLTSVGGTASSGGSGICLGTGFRDISRVTNTALNDNASIAMLAGVGCKKWLHSSLNGNGVAGTYAGFHIWSAGLANLLNNIEVHTFLNGVWQEAASGGNLLSVIVSSEGDIYFKTNKPYNEVRLVFNSLLSVAYAVDVFYAFGQTTRPDLEVLPVTFGLFKAEATSRGNALSWQFHSDATPAVMLVEKSSDGIHFIPAGQLLANETGHYDFYDHSSWSQTYYRIKASWNGKEVYSSVQRVSGTKTERTIRINTPVHDLLQLQLGAEDAGMYAVQVYNMHGHLVYQTKQMLVDGSRFLLPRSRLKSGVYILQLTLANGESLTQKIVLN